MILTCQFCKKEFTTSQKDRKNCSKECLYASRKGIKPTWLKGFTSETAKKYGFQKNNKLGFSKGYKPWNKGKNITTNNFLGKTWEELYGQEKADEIREKRSNNKNPLWKGDKAGHHSLHTWVRTRLGTPQKCEHCGTTDAKFFDWANKSGEYKRDLEDWLRLCRKCHSDYDRENGRGSKIFDRFGDKTGKYIK